MNMFEQTQEQPKKPFAELPSSIRGLVACRVCARIKTVSQFADTGCESCYEDITNGRKVCEEYFGDQHKMLQEILTPNFEGVARKLCTPRPRLGTIFELRHSNFVIIHN